MTHTTDHDAFFASFPNHELTELEARAVLSNYELTTGGARVEYGFAPF